MLICLAIAETNGQFVVNGNFIVSAFHKELHVSGTILEYTGSGTPVERLNGTGMIYEDIIVHVGVASNLIFTSEIYCIVTHQKYGAESCPIVQIISAELPSKPEIGIHDMISCMFVLYGALIMLLTIPVVLTGNH